MARVIPLDLIFGAIIWFALFAIFAIVFFPPTNGVWTETIKAVGAAVAIAGGIFAPMSAIVMARYQYQLTTDLEKLKTEYVQQVEHLRSNLSTGLEVKKALIAGKIRAFDTMLTSAHFFYYVVRQCVFGGIATGEDLLTEADKRAAEASSVVWHLSAEDRIKWFTVYQLSMHLIGILKVAPSDQKIELFNAHAGALGDAIAELEAAGRSAFEEADKYQLKVAEDEFQVFNRPRQRA
jgi:hypothetical protein